MTYLSIKNHFKEYRQIVFQIEEVETKLLQKRHKLTGPHGLKYSDVHFPPMTEAYKIELIAEIDSLEKKLAELKQQEKILYNKHLKEIELVTDDNSQRILRSVYLHRMRYEEIADIMDLSVGRVRNIKYAADKLLSEAIESHKVET